MDDRHGGNRVEWNEVDLNYIGNIVDRYGDKGDTFWSRYHETTRGQLTMAHWVDHFEWKFLLKHLVAQSRILDYGCGSGHSDIFLAMHGHEIVGYDISPTAIDIAKYIASIQTQDIRDRLEFHLNKLPVRNYDIIWSSHTIEHISLEMLPEVFNLVRSVASEIPMLISVPLGTAYDVPNHVNHWYSDKELEESLSRYVDITWTSTDNENQVIRAMCKV